MTRRRLRRPVLLAGVAFLIVAAVGAGVVYGWTFTPHGRLDLLFTFTVGFGLLDRCRRPAPHR